MEMQFTQCSSLFVRN